MLGVRSSMCVSSACSCIGASINHNFANASLLLRVFIWVELKRIKSIFSFFACSFILLRISQSTSKKSQRMRGQCGIK